MNHDEQRKSFLDELRSLDEPVKKRVLIISTIIIMIIVLYIWIGYFNSIVASSSQPTVATAVATSTGATSQGISFWQNIKNGMANIANIVRGPGEYTIQPK